jgi:hypothetical protein
MAGNSGAGTTNTAAPITEINATNGSVPHIEEEPPCVSPPAGVPSTWNIAWNIAA